jgi:PTS system N-acetylglucosamine-specific IIC component
LNDPNLIDEAALTALGSRGVLRIGDGAVQVVVGPIADQLASEIRAQWRAPPTRAMTAPPAVPPAAAAAAAPDRTILAEVLAALGGRGNITGLHANATRLVISVRDPAAVDESALGRLANAIARPAPASVHLIVGPEARSWLTAMETLTS